MIEPLLRASPLGVLIASFVGCGVTLDENSDDVANDAGRGRSAAAMYQPAVIDVASQRPPLSMQVARVTGPGCPSVASWDLEEVPQGAAFTLTFHGMTVEVPPVQTPVTRETYCDLYIDVGSSVPVSYAVASFQYFGFASLQSGMSGALGVRHGFTAATTITQMPEVLYLLDVPSDGSFAYEDSVVVGRDTSWSPCATSTQLGMRLRVSLTSANRERPGLVSLSNVDGAASEVRVNFTSRSCAASGVRVVR